MDEDYSTPEGQMKVFGRHLSQEEQDGILQIQKKYEAAWGKFRRVNKITDKTRNALLWTEAVVGLGLAGKGGYSGCSAFKEQLHMSIRPLMNARREIQNQSQHIGYLRNRVITSKQIVSVDDTVKANEAIAALDSAEAKVDQYIATTAPPESLEAQYKELGRNSDNSYTYLFTGSLVGTAAVMALTGWLGYRIKKPFDKKHTDTVEQLWDLRKSYKPKR